MATLAASSLAMTNNTDAEFRAWCTYVRDTFLLTGGWVQTSDSGQMNFATVSKPAGTQTKQGYAIFRMDDSLQATVPCYVRIDFGSGGNNTIYPAMWITIGTGSNGSGTITGIRMNGGGNTAPTVATQSNATAKNCYGSAATNRITVMCAADNGSCVGFGIERTKDVSGADTSTGLLVQLIGQNATVRPLGMTGSNSMTGSVTTMTYIPWGGTVPPMEPGWSYILFNNSTTAFSSDVGLGMPIPMGTVAKQPGLNFLICRTGDFLLEALITLTVYGASRVYLRSGRTPFIGNANSQNDDNTAVVLMRYD